MGKFDKLAKYLGLAIEKYGDDATKILEKIDNPELAVKLEGKPREQYLKALDEVYGEKVKRVSDMGFNPDTYYHGTPKEKIDAFDLGKAGENSGMKTSGNAIWLSSDPKVAEQYAHNFPKPEENPNIMDLKLRGKFKEIDDLNRYTGKERGHINSLAKQKGNNGVIYKGITDNIWEGPLAPGPSDIVAVFEPNQIRSTRASFDPRFKDSSLIMAGGLAVPMGSQVVNMNPLDDIKTGLGYYDKAKEAITKPLAHQLNIAQNPNDERLINETLKTGLDPVNYIPGAAGIGLGALQMMTPSEDEMKLRALRKIETGGF